MRILAVTAHPDDVDFGAAGTMATWVAEGHEVAYCICTDGDAGGFDPAVPRSEIGGIRQAEQRAAAAAVGVDDVVFLGYPDGRLTASIELRRDISRQIRHFRPERLVIQSPERSWGRIYGSHPDHLAAGEAAICAVYPDARNPFAHLELAAERIEAWTVPEVWVMGGGLGAGLPSAPPRVYVDITDGFDQKIAALRAHVSQTSHMEDLDGFLRGWGETQGKEGGLEAGRLAESFSVVNTA